MDAVAFVLALALSGLIVGALARLAVPGRDPMSIWRTIVLGVVGSLLGGVLAQLLAFEAGGGILFSVLGAVLLLIAYRRVVQNRGVTGPGAQ